MTEDIPVIKDDNKDESGSGIVSTIFSDSRLVEVLHNEKIVWEYILQDEKDENIRKDIEEIISLIADFDKRKRAELTAKDLKERLSSSADQTGEVS